MKYLMLMSLGILITTASNASKNVAYQCNCVDTGIECDGMEKMKVSVTGTTATVDVGDKEWEMNDQYETEIDPTYSPKTEENQKYKKFKITSGGGGYNFDVKKSSFLIGNNLITGTKKSSVKFQAVNPKETGGGFWSWFFECTRD